MAADGVKAGMPCLNMAAGCVTCKLSGIGVCAERLRRVPWTVLVMTCLEAIKGEMPEDYPQRLHASRGPGTPR